MTDTTSKPWLSANKGELWQITTTDDGATGLAAVAKDDDDVICFYVLDGAYEVHRDDVVSAIRITPTAEYTLILGAEDVLDSLSDGDEVEAGDEYDAADLERASAWLKSNSNRLSDVLTMSFREFVENNAYDM